MTVVTNPARTDDNNVDIELEILENERLENARFESQRLENERLERERLDRERLDNGRLRIQYTQDYHNALRDYQGELGRENPPIPWQGNLDITPDIVFVAGFSDDTQRFPAHRRVFMAASPIFIALLNTESDVILVNYVDKRGFEQLIRYYYCEPNTFDSVEVTRCSLDAAYKFICAPLVERCARKLDEMLNVGVALEILPDLRYMCARLPGAASAPPLEVLNDDNIAKYLAKCSVWCDSLAHNALLVIDENADQALADERIKNLTYADLALIVKRDTLQLSSELVLIEALSRWSAAACRRANRDVTKSNQRAALGELSYCPRYLTLSGNELHRGCELLSDMECTFVLARARKTKPPVPMSAEQEALLRRWARPRPTEPTSLPVHLSPRSKPPPEETLVTKLCSCRPKRPKKAPYAPEEPEIYQLRKRGCCACFGEGLLRAFICLFD